MKAKIGIVVCGIKDQRQFVTDTYIQAVKRAGGLPVIIPAVKSNEALLLYAQMFDGFLFCGGADITPLLFGEEPKDGIGETDIALDIFQIRLMRQVLSLQKPVLGICRGMQVLNVACGGTIYQDIALQPGNPINHMQTSLQRADVSHKVTISPNTKLHRVLGNFVYTNSFHHQTVGKLGKGIIASAHTSDQAVEAIEVPSVLFAIGVQWHPECMLSGSSQMKDLFSYFLHKCRFAMQDH